MFHYVPAETLLMSWRRSAIKEVNNWGPGSLLIKINSYKITIYKRPAAGLFSFVSAFINTVRLNKNYWKKATIHKSPIVRPLDSQIIEAVELLSKAKRPLVIIGKGAAFSDGAPDKIRTFIQESSPADGEYTKYKLFEL